MSNDSLKQFAVLAVPAAMVAAYYSDSEYFPIIAGTIGTAALFPLMVDGASGLFIEEHSFDPEGKGDYINGISYHEARSQFKKRIEENHASNSYNDDDFDIEIEYVGANSIKKDNITVLGNKSNIEKSNDFFNPGNEFVKNKQD